MNCAYGIMMKETKIPKDIVNMIMDFIIVPNKKGLIDDFQLINVRNNTPDAFMRIIKYNNKKNLTLKRKLGFILYNPLLIQNNTKFMSIRNEINQLDMKSLDKFKMIKIIENKKFDYSKYDPKCEYDNRFQYYRYEDNTFKKRINNIDATYKITVDNHTNCDKRKIINNNILRYYQIDAYSQKQFSKVRNTITSYHIIKKYMKEMNEIINVDDINFNSDEHYDFKPIIYDNTAICKIYSGTDCVNNFEYFEIVNKTKTYFNIRVIYKVDDNNKITINEKVKINNIWDCLLKNKQIEKNEYNNMLPFHSGLKVIDCITLDMDKINKKYNLNIDMKHWKKCYGSKYSYITPSTTIDKLSLMFMSNDLKKLNEKIFKKFQNKYFK
tara:strand:- start:97 stop:1242 length:1146 start_codon:yes stop_codon:yes gene_type:complete